jgi:hypothetical protein
MKVFISWSKDRSKIIASGLKFWIENLFQNVEAFMSESDIEPGSPWAQRLNGELEESKYGIVCLTPENLREEWILFEAGALSKGITVNKVTPFLFQHKGLDIAGPLSQFQSLQADKIGAYKLAEGINKILEKPLNSRKLEDAFELWWPKFEIILNSVPELKFSNQPDKRQDRELIEEILQYTRNKTAQEAEITRLREMSESEMRKMKKQELIAFVQSSISRLNQGLSPAEMISMKDKIYLSIKILKEGFPELTEMTDKILELLKLKKTSSS